MPKPIRKVKQAAITLIVGLFVLLGVFTAREDLQTEKMAGAAVTSSDESQRDAAQEAANASSEVAEGFTQPRQMPIPSREEVDMETLWLARVIYSETKQPREQELVAWTIRNRVETGYRGNRTYRGTVLDPYQYSAFNPGNQKRAYYTSLEYDSEAEGWKRALAIAHHVKNAPSTQRPFPQETRHFYSERSMVGGRTPAWARGEDPVDPDRPYNIEAERFRFFEGVS